MRRLFRPEAHVIKPGDSGKINFSKNKPPE
jgi:hypothetical protein